MSLRVFAGYSGVDQDYVLRVLACLRRSDLTVYAYGDSRTGSFPSVIENELRNSDAFLVFVGESYHESIYLKQEVEVIVNLAARQAAVVLIRLSPEIRFEEVNLFLANHPAVSAFDDDDKSLTPSHCAKHILDCLNRATGRELVWSAQDGLPFDPQLFSYEKEIIRFFAGDEDVDIADAVGPRSSTEEDDGSTYREKLLAGCPSKWPTVVDFRGKQLGGAPTRPYLQDPDTQGEFGYIRSASQVGAAALRGYHTSRDGLNFPKAGPREELLYPLNGPAGNLSVGILVSGGIAPGINAVIDGLVQRHARYADRYGHTLSVIGFHNGFHGVMHENTEELSPAKTADHANYGGSMIGTYRMDKLIDPGERLTRLRYLAQHLDKIDILYMIGGDRTMRAAHALWNVALERVDESHREFPLSVVAIPKTMDNNILWVWQSFGFMSAVEKAREMVRDMYTEVSSNPSVCVLQLFGSDSGFVVSHAVLASAAGRCDLALIPEVDFSLLGIASYLENVIHRRNAAIPRGLIVMAETAIPIDAVHYVDPTGHPLPAHLPATERKRAQRVIDRLQEIGALTPKERDAIIDYHSMRERGQRLEGQTSDELRQAGLKIVLHGLEALLRRREVHGNVRWSNLRMVANEPRHLVRSINPSTSDIVIGQRLGTLAVDNAMGGFTDFMISQWLTEFVLVPLELVVLGRKRIPQSGIFWKSVLAKTGQEGDLVTPWPRQP